MGCGNKGSYVPNPDGGVDIVEQRWMVGACILHMYICGVRAESREGVGGVCA